MLRLSAFAQDLPKSDEDVLVSLEQNLSYLADDRMEGRLTGSRGEKMAYDFITQYFQSLNLWGKGTNNTFTQEFTFKKLAFRNVNFTLKKVGPPLNLQIKPSACFPIASSGVGEVYAKTVWLGYGLSLPGTGINDYAGKKNLKGKIFVMRLGAPLIPEEKKEMKAFTGIETKIDTALAKGAAAVVFVNDNPAVLEPDFKPFTKLTGYNIPVYFIGHELKPDTLQFVDAHIYLKVDTATVELTGHNVIGYQNNKSPNTIVIGAHYDHLGYNELGGSTYRKEQNEKPQIHNGADDNASGTAALIEMAELLIKSPFRSYNYLFIAFSGEEEGLLGSNYFCKNPTIDLGKVNYMINMDMLGRLDSTKNTFAISGTGTSPTWKEVLPSVRVNNLTAKYTESGTGSSDQTSFYNVKIPALHFFTGSHEDYHKPSDDPEKINYRGELEVIKYIYTLIGKLDKEPKLKFTPTKEDSTTQHVSFKVTLGIMPDYLYEGKGLKVDGVTEGKPASVAGIKRGDVILQLGEHPTGSMDQYMAALGKFNKGDATKVKVLREGKEVSLDLKF